MSLRGTPIDSDDFVNATDIGSDDNALFCLTNNTNCCGPGDPTTTGDWYFPNGVDRVGTQGSGRTDFYYRNRGLSVVRLNRDGNPSERGRFHCELLGSTIYANIRECVLKYNRQQSVC